MNYIRSLPLRVSARIALQLRVVIRGGLAVVNLVVDLERVELLLAQ